MNTLQKMYSAILARGRRSVPTHDEVQKDFLAVERNLASRDMPF